MKETHLLRLRHYLSELLDHHGILHIDSCEDTVEHIRNEYLMRLAFKFYRQLEGFRPANSSTGSSTVDMPCLECGQSITFPAPDPEEVPLFLCPDCVRKIGEDLLSWEAVAQYRS